MSDGSAHMITSVIQISGKQQVTFEISPMKTSFGSSPSGSVTSKLAPKSQKLQQKTPYTSAIMNWNKFIHVILQPEPVRSSFHNYFDLTRASTAAIEGI